jgi:hypothetical protein
MPVVSAFLNTRLSPKTATDSSSLKSGNISTEALHIWHSSVDKKHSFLHVEFEVKFVIYFAKKFMPNKKWHFFMRVGPSFFSKRGI